jgi:hypothetical protein
MLRIAGGFITLISDRYRGHTGGLPKQIKRLIEAFGISLCAGFTEWDIIGSTACLWVGTTLGYGNAIGPASTGGQVSRYKGNLGPLDPGPEIWQSKFLLDNLWLSLFVFGAIWAIPVTIYSYFFYTPWVRLLAVSIVTFPLSCASGQLIHRHFGCDGWRSQQWAFGLIMAILAYLI